jgi:hypothetical protein
MVSMPPQYRTRYLILLNQYFELADNIHFELLLFAPFILRILFGIRKGHSIYLAIDTSFLKETEQLDCNIS